MDLIKKYSSVAGRKSINQYCPPRCYELEGKEFRFVVDTGEETGTYTLRVTGKDRLEWAKGDGAKEVTVSKIYSNSVMDMTDIRFVKN